MVCMGCVLLSMCVLLATTHHSSPTELASAAEMREINWAYDQDSTTQALVQKNDDGHTAMWNAAAGTSEASARKSAIKFAHKAVISYQGGPKFHTDATGWVQDYGLSATQKLLATSVGGKKVDVLGMSRAAKARAMEQVQAWETKELRRSYPDPVANVKAANAADVWISKADKALKAASPLAKKARTQDLWNAAGNDEITLNTIGHAHPSEMDEIRKMAPEYKDPKFVRRAHLTQATDMDYEPLKWMHEQGEPGSRKAAPTKLQARTQQLWNAAANDDIHSGEGSSAPAHEGYHPGQWLKSQVDRTEMGSSARERRDHKRLFSESEAGADNAEGAYDDDSSMGIKVDALEGKAQMLASAPVTSLEGEEAVADVDENAAIKLELDELKAKAMGAMEDLPEGVSPVVRGIVAQDYDSVVTYLDQVAADATGIQHGAALPTPAVDPLAIDAVAIAGKPVSLKSLKEVPRKELVLALTNAVSAPLDGYRRWKSAHPNDPEEVSTQKVMAAMSLAKDMCAEILSDPHAAQVAATAQVEDMSRWQELVQEQRLQAERLAELRVDAAHQRQILAQQQERRVLAERQERRYV